MPRVATTIPETHESITRPVAMSVIRQVCANLSIPKNVRILFPGQSDEVSMTGSTLNYDGDPSQFNSESRVLVEVSEELIEERVLSTSIYKQENLPCFVDAALGIRLYPIYSSTQMVINFTYRAPNRTTAQQFRNDAVILSAQSWDQSVHEIDYHYPIPYEYLHLLEHLHALRENQAGYGDDFSKWMSDCLSAKATNLTTLIGTNPQLVIAEQQIRPLGWFDFTAAPAPEQKDNDTGPYNVTFEYRFTYDKVIGAVAHYPLVVHSQLIDAGWHGTRRPSGNILDPETRKGAASYSRYAMDYIARLNVHCPPTDGIRIPAFDEWSPATVHPATTPLVSIMLAVNPDDKREVLDLKDMGDFLIEPDVLEFLKTEAPYLNQFSQSIVHVGLYRGDVPVEDGSLLIDSDLIVRSNRDLELRDQYHLRISLITDLTFLRPGAFERFRSAGQACLNILSTLQWTLLRDGYLPKLLNGKYVPRADMMRIAQRINDLRHPHQGVRYAMQTVGNFLIETDRRTNYANYAAQADGNAGQGTTPSTGSGTPLSVLDTNC